MLSEGETAPDFALPGVRNGEFDEFRLSAYTDRVVVLAFYPADFSPACTEELCTMRDVDLFSLHRDVALFGISADSTYSHRAFADEHGLNFPLLTDRLGEVADAYGVRYDEFEGLEHVPKRAVFVLDPERTVRYAWSDDDAYETPDIDAVREAVESLQDDRIAIERYREAHDHYWYGRTELESGVRAHEDGQFGLARETFTEAAWYFGEACSGFETAERFGESERILANAERAADRTRRLRQAAEWYRTASELARDGEAALAAEYAADAADAHDEAKSLPAVEDLYAF